MAIPVFSVGGQLHAADLNFLLAPPRAILRQTAVQSLANTTWTVVSLDTQDEASDCTTTTGAAAKVTINTAGLYHVSFDMGFSSSAAGERFTSITKNGNSPAATAANALLLSSQAGGFAGAGTLASGAGLLRFVAGDFLQLYAYQSTGGVLNTVIWGGAPKMSVVFASA